MKRSAMYVLFSVFFLLTPWGFAQNSDQISSSSGVLVSSSIRAPMSDQDSPGNNGNSDGPSQNSAEDGSNSHDAAKSSTDEIVIKATNAVMFQMTANLKLTQDQMSAIRPIVTTNIVKVRDLQQSLEKGAIDGKTMYNKREQLTEEEDQELSRILTPDQMKVWINIQSE